MRPPVCLILTTVFALAASAFAKPPNVVFIMADDLGYGDLSCFGQRVFETPCLDRMAAEGMRLTQHYAGSTVCAPSRCALMTGRHTGHCEVRGNTEHTPEGQAPLSDAAVTIAELLREAGYATGAFGKWGLGYPGSVGDPLNQGFERFFGYNCQRHAHRYYTDYLWDDKQRIEIEPTVYTHDVIFERALDWIRANRDRPFFCYLPVTVPHAAMEAPEEARAPWRDRLPQFEEAIGRYAGAETPNPVASFPAMVQRLDGDVGRLVDLLDELGLRDDTLIVFTSDNGPHTEGGHHPDFFNCNGPFRGLKRDLYEGGIRVPTIVSWPKHVRPGSASDLASAGWDWAPTLCELAGIEPSDDFDGVSLVPTLTGRGEQVEHEFLYWEFHERGGRQAIRQGPWKAVRLDVGENPTATPELYNLDHDRGETTNVAADHPEVVTRLVALMEAARTASPRYDFGSKARQAK